MMRQLFVLFLTSTLLLGCGGASSSSTSGSSSGNNSGGGDGGGNGGDGGGDGGGGSGGGGGEPPFVSAFNVFEPAARQTYEDDTLLDITRVQDDDELGGIADINSLPATGQLNYAGYLHLFVGNALGQASINGEATLTVELLGRTLSGSADNFAGYAPDENNTQQLIAYEGDPVMFSNGTLTTGPNDEAVISLDIDGTLSNGVNTFVIDGTLEGNIYGAAGEGLHAYGTPRAGGLGDMNTMIDGQAATYETGVLSMLQQTAQP